MIIARVAVMIGIIGVSLGTVLPSAVLPVKTLDSSDFYQEEVNQQREKKVSTFSEFCEALEEMAATGGNIYLTADITIPEDQSYIFMGHSLDNKITIDVGEHTFYIKGKLELYPYLTITGRGGENGIFSIMPGGWLELSSLELLAQEGYAIRREDGSILSYGSIGGGAPDFLLQGEVEESCAVAVSDSSIAPTKLPLVVVPKGEEVEEFLPKTDSAQYYEPLSGNPQMDLPVVWELENYQEQIQNQERFLLTGNYRDVYTFAPPACIVTFEKDYPAVMGKGFLQQRSDQTYKLDVDFFLSDSSLPFRLDYSLDGETWRPVPEDSDSEYFLEGDKVAYWGVFEELTLPLYLSVAVTLPNGEERYSDVILLTEESDGGSIGGNRGGGTDLDDSPDLPPNSGSEDEILGEEDPVEQNQSEEEESISWPSQEEKEGIPAWSQEASSEESAKSSREEDLSLGKPEGGNLPTENSEPEEVSPIQQQPNQEPEELPSFQENEQDGGEPQHQERRTALWQMIAGLAVTGGIVGLVVTFHVDAGWGGKMIRLLKRKG